MGALVLKEWKASDQPVDTEGHRVSIVGRQDGLLSWLLALCGIDPTTTIKINEQHIEFTNASISGSEHRLIPLGSISSTYFGYFKPWKNAIAIFVVALLLIAPMVVGVAAAFRSSGMVVLGWLLGIGLAVGLAVLYYYLNRTLTLGFVEVSGMISGIRFKRSVIENVDINAGQARYICNLTRHLIETRLNR
jgi:hypothetical protein